MEPHTRRQRISAAFRKASTDQEPSIDRIPAYPFTGHCNAQLKGVSIRKFLPNPEVYVKDTVGCL